MGINFACFQKLPVTLGGSKSGGALLWGWPCPLAWEGGGAALSDNVMLGRLIVMQEQEESCKGLGNSRHEDLFDMYTG